MRVRIGAGSGSVKALACVLGALVGCAPTPPSVGSTLAVTPEPGVVYVSPTGNDRASGTRDAPIRSIAQAMLTADVVRLLPGVYGGPELVISRPLQLEGAPTATVATLTFVGSEATVRNLNFTHGLGVGLAERVELADVSVSSAEGDQALSIHRSRVDLRRVRVKGGQAGALTISSSTVSALDLTVAGGQARAGVRAERSQLEWQGAKLKGGQYASVQLGEGSQLIGRGVTLGPSPGNNLVALHGARVDLEEARFQKARNYGLLLRGASGEVRSSTLSGGHAAVAALGASRLRLEDVHARSGGDGAVLAQAFRDETPQVTVASSTLSVDQGPGVVVGAGVLSVLRSSVVGTGTTSGRDHPSLVARGPQARLVLRQVRVSHSPGPALEAFEDASLEVEGLAVDASADGLHLEGLWTEPVRLSRLRLSAVAGACLRVHRSRVTLEDLEAGGVSVGLLLGEETEFQLSRARIDAKRGGLLGFGGSSIAVRSSTLSASGWALFSTCGEATELDIGPAVHTVGKVAVCP